VPIWRDASGASQITQEVQQGGLKKIMQAFDRNNFL